MSKNPDFIKLIKAELADWRRWSDRLVVLLFALLAGLTVACFTWISESAFDLFFAYQTRFVWLALLITPVLTALIVWITRSFFPGAAGSGIAPVIASLSKDTPSAQRALFVSLKLSLATVVLATVGLLAGLSLGRGGPSVLVAAGVMYSARMFLSKRSQIRPSGLLLAGGAAGIAAAFNTPLGGVMFAIEALSRNPEDRRSGLLLAGIVVAGLVAISIHGNTSYFGVIHVESISWSLLVPGLLVAVACGLAGGLFSRLLIYSLDPTSPGWLQTYRRKSPYWFAAICGLAVAVLGILTGGDTFGTGYGHTRAMLENHTDVTEYFVLWKAAATWLTTWAGVPAGIFAPSLAIGGALGNQLAVMTEYLNPPALIALGMVGFLAAVTQAPLTALIIVMEMVSGQPLVLSLMSSAMIASAVSRLVSRPLYPTLAELQLGRLAPRLTMRESSAVGEADSATPGR